MAKLFFTGCLLLVLYPAFAQMPRILTQREQAVVIDELLDDRLRTLLPGLMRREGFDMWVIISREYNEDPVIETLLPATWMAARRTTMLVVYDNGKDTEYLAVSRYDVGNTFKRAWDPDTQPDQWAQLAQLITSRNPKKIGVNKAEHFGHADGLSANDYALVLKSLPETFRRRVTSAEALAVSWLETRSEREMTLYPQICRIAHAIILEGLSDQVIQPGVTTTDDVVWWYRERLRELHLDTWFQPSVSIQRQESDILFSKRPRPSIQPGDLLHVDFGISYLRLNTDTQQHAYVLKPGETDAPDYLKKALAQGNALQEILTSNFALGKTGNQILADTRKQALAQGITPSIYTHPIGYHGHAAGTTIGLWDMQQGVPHTGDYPMHYNTAYSIELNARVTIAEWKKDILIQLEEDGYFDATGFRYIDGRQTQLILIGQSDAINRQRP